MTARRDIGSWLNGPQVGSTTPSAWPGERLGRPQQGRGSIGRVGRRLLGVVVDWVIALLIARAFLGGLHLGSMAPLLVLFVEHLLLVATAGGSVGHRLVGLRIETVDGGPPGPRRALIRAALLCLAVPALIWDGDQRGLHDKAAGTLVART
jgi:uncharacterized RDD family membrane protein YckC